MSPGPKSVNVTVAPASGFTRPLTIAVSVSVPAPSVTFGDAVVAIVVGAGRTVVPDDVPRAESVIAPLCCVLSTI